MIRKVALIIAICISFSLFGYFLYKFLYTPRIVFGAKGFTEYSPGSPGKVFVQVLDNYFTPVDNAVCKLTAYYPNGDYFVKDVLMLYHENGLYYFDFIAPYIEGVYMVTVECVYPSDLEVITPTESKLWYKDGSTVSTSSLTLDFPYFDTTGNAELIIYFTSISDPVDIYLNDTNSNDWIFYDQATKNTPQKSIVFPISNHNPLSVLINSTKSYSLDMVNVYIYTNTSRIVSQLRGGGEIHVEIKKVAIHPDEETPYVKTIS